MHDTKPPNRWFIVYLTLVTLVLSSLTLEPLCYAKTTDTLELEPSTIYGENNGHYVEAAKSYAVSVIEVVPEETQNLALQDILGVQTSLQVRSAGGRSSYSIMSIRGASSSQVKIFIDGLEINSGDSASVDLSTLSIDNFERIEIYRSHAPARFGTGALGGVVNLVTRRDQQPKGRFKLGAGSFGFVEGSLSQSLVSTKTTHQILIQRQREEGSFDYTDDNGTPGLNIDDTERTRINNDFDLWRLRWDGRFHIDREQSFFWGIGHFDRDKGLAGHAKFQSPHVRYREQHTDAEAGYQKHGAFYKDSSLLLNWKHRRRRDQYADPSDELGVTTGGQDQHNDFGAHDFRMVHEHHDLIMPWSLHLLYRSEAQTTEERLGNLRQDERKRSSWTIGLDVECYLIEDRLELRPSLSGLFLDDTFSDAQEQADHWTWNLTTLYHCSAWLDLRAGYSHGVRVPTFSELFGDRGAIVGNADLTPETSENWDIGLVLHKTNFLFTRSAQAELTYFGSERSNLIEMVYDSRGIGRSENIGDGDIEGFECSLTARCDHGFQFGFNFTTMTTEQRNPSFYKGQSLKIPGIFEDTATPWVQLDLDAWTIRYEAFLAAEKAFNRANTTTADDQENHRLSIGYGRPKWNLALDVDNLTDENLEDFNNWPQPGRTFTFSAMFKH